MYFSSSSSPPYSSPPTSATALPPSADAAALRIPQTLTVQTKTASTSPGSSSSPRMTKATRRTSSWGSSMRLSTRTRSLSSRGGTEAGGNDTVCSICLCNYREAEMLRMLPDCKHSFHVTCVDAWLKLNASCPVCRNSPLPTPLSTPLQEVVPLSQYSDGRRRQ